MPLNSYLHAKSKYHRSNVIASLRNFHVICLASHSYFWQASTETFNVLEQFLSSMFFLL